MEQIENSHSIDTPDHQSSRAARSAGNAPEPVAANEPVAVAELGPDTPPRLRSNAGNDAAALKEADQTISHKSSNETIKEVDSCHNDAPLPLRTLCKQLIDALVDSTSTVARSV